MGKSNKKGQFYLVAAIIIIIVLIGFTSVNNQFSSTKENTKIYDLKKELNLESIKVVSYGSYSQLEATQMATLMENFTALYTSFAGEGRSMYFVYGDKNQIVLRSFEEISSGTAQVVIGSQPAALTLYKKKFSEIPLPISGDKVSVVIDGINYDFQLKEGENFYFIITQIGGGETQIVKG